MTGSPCQLDTHATLRRRLPAEGPHGGPAGWVTPADLANARGVPVRTIRGQVARQVPEHARRKVGGRVYFDPRFLPGATLDLARVPRPKSAATFDPARWDEKSAHRHGTILRILRDADEHAGRLRSNGIKLTEADRIFRDQRGDGYYEVRFSLRSLQRWRSASKAGQPFPENRGRPRGRVNRPIGRKAQGAFLGLHKRPGTRLRRNYCIVAAMASEHPGDADWSWPSESTVRNWLKREHPSFYLDYYRKGADYWRARNEPKLNRAPQDVPGNEVWELDGSKCDFFGQRNGQKFRYTYALVRDVGTRMYLGHAVGASESTELVVKALRRAALRYGAPRAIRTDQGRANRGTGVGDTNRRKSGVDWKRITGIVEDMQAEFQLMTGRSGWMKGSVESGMNSVGMGLAPYIDGYCGNRPANRPRGIDRWADDHVDRLKTADQIDSLLGEFLEAENLRPREDMGGDSPLARFERTRITFREVDQSVVSYRLLRTQRTKVTNRGVRLQTPSEPVYYGANDPRVWERIGQEVVVRVDDDDLARVLLCDDKGRGLFYVYNDLLRGVSSETLREAGKRKQKARKARREHWENVDTSARPIEDECIRLQRKHAETQAAKAPKAPARDPGKVILFSGDDGSLLEEEKQILRAAVGAESVSPPPGPTLADLARSGHRNVMDDVPALDFADVGLGNSQVMEDRDDAFRHFARET